MALTLNEMLKEMVDRGASDLHVTTNSPPQIRVDGLLTTLNSPPIKCTNWRLMANPRPVPSKDSRLSEACTKGSKTASSLSSGMPMPLSRT